MNPERKLALTLAHELAMSHQYPGSSDDVVARAEKYLAFLSKPPLPGYVQEQWLKQNQAAQNQQNQQNPLGPQAWAAGLMPPGEVAAPGHDPKRWPR